MEGARVAVKMNHNMLTKKGRYKKRPFRCIVMSVLMSLLLTRDSQRIATFRSAFSPTYLSNAHSWRKAFPIHLCPYL